MSPAGSLMAGMFSLIDGEGAGEGGLGSGRRCRSDSGLISRGSKATSQTGADPLAKETSKHH